MYNKSIGKAKALKVITIIILFGVIIAITTNIIIPTVQFEQAYRRDHPQPTPNYEMKCVRMKPVQFGKFWTLVCVWERVYFPTPTVQPTMEHR